jgi:DNA-binding SARP family transcriptional activator
MMKLKLFGVFELTNHAGNPIALPAKKDQALLTVLALSDAVAREQVTALLWSDRAEQQARKSLRQSLVVLRRVLKGAGEVLPPDRRQVLSLAADELDIDARHFEVLARAGDLTSLLAAAALYDEGLLQHFAVPGDGFSDWLEGQRRRYDDLASGVFAALGEKLILTEDWTEAEAVSRRLIAINPLRETGHCLLMQALSGAGRRGEALQQFHSLSGLLRHELDVLPDLDSTSLYQTIRQQPVPRIVSLEGSEAPIADPRPGIVVLPLRMADDDVTLADGLSEEIIASLSAYRWFFVISGLQAMSYRGRAVTPTELAVELGVGYVLDGDIRRNGNRLHLRLNLSETTRGELIWSDSIECYFDEALQVQGELARHVAQIIEPEILRGEDEGRPRAQTGDMDAWHLAVRARRLADHARRDSLEQAYALASQAIKLKPDSPFGHAALAWSIWMRDILFRGHGIGIPEGIAAAERAIERDSRLYLGHVTLGVCQLRIGEHDRSVTSLRRAIDLNPSFAPAYNQITSGLTLSGRSSEAVDYIGSLDRISPHDAFRGYYQCVRALTYFMVGNDGAAIENAQASLAGHPIWLSSELVLLAASQRAGEVATTEKAMISFRKNHGKVTIEKLREDFPFRHDSDFQVLGHQLRAAGVPGR